MTVTDNEKLIRRLEDEVEYRVLTAVALSKGGHDHEEQVRQGRASVRFLAAGFPRSEVPDASAEHAYQGNRSQDTCWVMVDGDMCRKPVEAHMGTQGEPSDAQVEAAGVLLYGISWGTDLADRDLIRDALRAALSLREGGVR